MAYENKGHRCTFCNTTAANRHTKDIFSAQVCERDLGKLGEVLVKAGNTKHNLHWSVHQKLGVRVLCCNKRDAFATVAPHNIFVACTPKAKKPNWERLAAGKFPTHGFGNFCLFSRPFLAGPFGERAPVRERPRKEAAKANL